MNSKELIGNVKESFRKEPLGLEYKSYYSGWLKGRIELIHSTNRKYQIKMLIYDCIVIAVSGITLFTIFFLL